MSLLDKKTRGDATKLLIFILITSMASAVLVVLIGNFTFGSTNTYKAIFSDATGLVKGDDIRIAGVKVGSVKKVAVYGRDKALVEFTVLKSSTVTKSSGIQIRYRNLTGQRYVNVTQGVGDTAPQPDDSVIPMSRTTPAVDLTILFNGFKPLFAALTPADVNKLSYEIVQIFQGEGGNVEGLLTSTSSVTQTLAAHDRQIGSLIHNLNQVMVTVGNRDRQLTQLLLALRQFVGGLKNDRGAILGSLDSISNLTDETAGLLSGIRPSLIQDVKHLRTVAGNINKGRASMDASLQIMPIKLKKIGRTAIYGSFFNFYLCSFRGEIGLPTGQRIPLQYNTGAARCHLR